MIKIIIISDLHISSNNDEAEQSLKKIISFAKKHDLLLIAGNLINSKDITDEAIKLIKRNFETLKDNGTRIVYSPGEGETDKQGQISPVLFDLKANHIFYDAKINEPFFYKKNLQKLYVYGYPTSLNNHQEDQKIITNLNKIDPTGFHLGLFHLNLITEKNKIKSSIISLEDKYDDLLKLDFYGLGSIQNFRILRTYDRIIGVYPGSPIKNNQNENKYAVSLSVAADKIVQLKRLYIHSFKSLTPEFSFSSSLAAEENYIHPEKRNSSQQNVIPLPKTLGINKKNGFHLGINLGHDRSVALVQNGEIKVAIHQERLDRCKHSVGFLYSFDGNTENIQLPHEAINYCLDAYNLHWSDLTTITGNMPGVDFSDLIINKTLPKKYRDKVYKIPSHHLAHAYSAYWPSGFDEAIILVADASGSTTPERLTESYTIYKANKNKIEPIHSEKVKTHLSPLATLGFLYEYVTKQAGFVTNLNQMLEIPEAGKLMGLAPYGSEQKNWQKWLKIKKGSYSIETAGYDIFLEIEALKKKYDNQEGPPYLRPYIIDLAFKIQKELEEALMHLVSLAIKETGLKKICLAGGIALNSVANYKLLKNLKLEDIFIFPSAGDAGVAAGCALWAYNQVERGTNRIKLTKANLGIKYDEVNIAKALKKFQHDINIEKYSPEEIPDKCASIISKGHILAHFEGGSEFGPRALGYRSIVADPTFNKMKDILNARVKFREAFRPFAPVIPEENISEVFEQDIPSPFMLLVSDIKKEFHEKIPGVTHQDGTGRVQTVTKEQNNFFYELCHKVTEYRQGPPVILNTSFNVAGQPIVETPEEAIETFLRTDIDYLSLENYLITKKNNPIKDYQDHLANLRPSPLPKGLPPDQPSVLKMMEKLDSSIFTKETIQNNWSQTEIKKIAAQGAIFKENSFLFEKNPLGSSFTAQLSNNVLMIINPHGESFLREINNKIPAKRYDYKKTRLLSAYYFGSPEELENLRISLQLTSSDFEKKLTWAKNELAKFKLISKNSNLTYKIPDNFIEKEASLTFEQFKEENFYIYSQLEVFRNRLKELGYNQINICQKLEIESLQNLQPTHIHYYEKYKLGETDLDNLIKIFFLRGALDEKKLINLLSEKTFKILKEIGLLIERGEAWSSRVDLFCVENLFVATDHRFLLLEEDKMIKENPVMYIGMDSLGLVYTAPRYSSENILDLCSGSGIQSLSASKYSSKVIGVDINPRAIRFSRFNAQLNGIYNTKFIQGDLYNALKNEIKFDIILANPPFVPSPDANLRFRDGGNDGENILKKIVNQSIAYLKPNGSLFIVSDLVDTDSYEEKLNSWLNNVTTNKLVLKTANRNEILFSVPHSHVPFGQSYQDYNEELDKWINNYRNSNLKGVNFGYILAKKAKQNEGSYFAKTIYNPNKPIYQHTKNYFKQIDYLLNTNHDQLYLELSDCIEFTIDFSLKDNNSKILLSSNNNPFISKYEVNKKIYNLLIKISQNNLTLKQISEKEAIINLIKKGIVKISLNKTDSFNKINYLVNTNINENFNQTDNKEKTEGTEEELDYIKEFETKTTPTCLTSYLKQN